MKKGVGMAGSVISDWNHLRGAGTDIGGFRARPIYTGVRMLETRQKLCHFVPQFRAHHGDQAVDEAAPHVSWEKGDPRLRRRYRGIEKGLFVQECGVCHDVPRDVHYPLSVVSGPLSVAQKRVPAPALAGDGIRLLKRTTDHGLVSVVRRRLFECRGYAGRAVRGRRRIVIN